MIARFALLLTCVFSAAGQPDAAPDIRVDVDVVNVLCTVRNWKGAYMHDLSSADFRILEDGKPQQIRYFAREVRTPITVALLVDVSGSVRQTLNQEKTAASRFFREVLEARDQALLVSFSHIVKTWQPLTSSFSSLRDALYALGPIPLNIGPEFDPHGGTLLYEAVEQVSKSTLARTQGRKAIVIVTDGVDYGSRIPAAAAIAAAQQADAVIYGIHYGSDRQQLEDGLTALRALAEPTGGREFHVSPFHPLEDIFETIHQEMRSQYALGFVSTNGAHDGGYRTLSVKTTHGRMTVQARQGYYAPK
jgi:Ca-activated chloride channel family protein